MQCRTRFCDLPAHLLPFFLSSDLPFIAIFFLRALVPSFVRSVAAFCIAYTVEALESALRESQVFVDTVTTRKIFSLSSWSVDICSMRVN